jgi:DNA mismatch repair protein MutS2
MRTSKRNKGIKVLDGELHLRRLQPEEALARLDTYLNQAFLAGLYSVRIIHGKGTGILREVVRRELITHPLVKSVRIANPEQGGEGVTIVEMEAL